MSATQDALVAVTGATGFVGRHVLAAFARRATSLRLLVRDPARLRLPAGLSGAPQTVRGDLADGDAPERLVVGADAVVHVAGLVAAPSKGDFFRINADATARLARAAAAAGVRRFVFVSTLAAREPRLSAYAASKAEAERAALAEHGSGAANMQVCIVRPPAVYGPGDTATLPLFDQLSRRTAWLPGHAEMRFSLIHAADLGEALARLAVDLAAGGGEILEIDDGKTEGYTWAEVAAIASDVLGRPVRVRHVPRALVHAAAHASALYARLARRSVMLSPGKARELHHPDWVARSPKVQERLDWTARLQFAEGFAETLAWYCANGWLPAARLPERLRGGRSMRHSSEAS